MSLDISIAAIAFTRAAAVLGRSQPAVSHALARLRAALGDPLLVREGRALVPTPRAEALADPVHRLLAELRRSLEAGAFDPATARRTFALACPDVLAPAIPALLGALGEAPGVRLELLGARGPASLDRADLLLDVLPEAAPGVVARRIGTLTQAVIARRGHPAIADWGLEAWVTWPHVLVRTEAGAPSLVERALAAAGRERSVGLAVGELLLAPHVVAGSDLLFTGPAEILSLLAEPLGLVLLPPPLPLPEVPVAALWPERLSAEPGHRWLRERVVAVLTALVSGGDSP